MPLRCFTILRIVTIAAVVVAAAGGAWVWSRARLPRAVTAALECADAYELLSLNPTLSEDEFYNHRVLGRMNVADPATRATLTQALSDGARESDGSIMACFNPRHGIRATRGGRVTELVICFECKQVRVYQNGRRVSSFLTSPSPQRVFDEVLRAARVPLADPP